LPIVTVLLISSFTFKKIAVKNAEDELIHEMKNKWEIIMSLQPDFSNPQSVHKKLSKVSNKTGLRITVIRPSGVVIEDSYLQFNMIGRMENHKLRPEVIGAMKSGEGYSKRFSSTIKKEMMYFAKPLPSGDILRIAYPMEYVNSVRTGFTNMFRLFYFVLLLTTALITVFLARKITLPVKQLDYVADKVEQGEKKIVFPEFKDATMSHVSKVIYRIYKSLNEGQKRLEEEQERLRKIFSTLEEGLLLLNKENVIERCNERISVLLKANFEKGMKIPTEIKEAKAVNFFNSILKSEDDYFPRFRYLDSYFEVYTRLVGNSKLIVIHDVTEKEKYINYKTNLIGNISHELKTPVATIMGYSETLLSHNDIDNETKMKFLKTVYLSSQRLNQLINDILELHKLEVEGKIVNIKETDINILIDELVRMYESLTDKKLRFCIDAETVKVGYEHLFSLLTNLIGNAFKYSHGNTVFLAFKNDNKNLVITVDDEGPVIPLEERERIFERFYTISKSRNKERAGTGLGLSIVKHIVEKYNGTICLTENDKGGNCFTITIPM
jgi:two-component system phosphate regulon sensor histidine kinase PhoR